MTGIGIICIGGKRGCDQITRQVPDVNTVFGAQDKGVF